MSLIAKFTKKKYLCKGILCPYIKLLNKDDDREQLNLFLVIHFE